MKMFFKTRSQARAFTSKNGKVVDQGTNTAPGRRWAFVFDKKEAE
ncbi:hypothetical protein [Pseudomonas phage Astolliot]|nr:hypothetical protein [Pseudomonas phage Astolliot]